MDCWKIQGYKSVNAEPASTFVRPPLVTFAVLRPTSAPSQQCSLVQTLMVPNPTQKVAGVMIIKDKTLFVIHLLECFAESTTMMFLVILILKL
jgi:hypothetical protein